MPRAPTQHICTQRQHINSEVCRGSYSNFAEIAAPLVTETRADMEEVGEEQAPDTEVETASDDEEAGAE